MRVRALFVAIVLVVGGWFVTGCAQPASPTSPGPVSLGPSLGPTAVTNHDLPPDDVSTAINPCTGTLTTVTVHFLNFVERVETDGSGGQHEIGSAVAEVSTADGFSGKVTFHFTF